MGKNTRAHHRQPAHRQAGASSRPSTLAKALQEYGRLVRTIYICRYVAGEELRRRYAASSTRATAMLFATGVAVLPGMADLDRPHRPNRRRTPDPR